MSWAWSSEGHKSISNWSFVRVPPSLFFFFIKRRSVLGWKASYSFLHSFFKKACPFIWANPLTSIDLCSFFKRQIPGTLWHFFHYCIDQYVSLFFSLLQSSLIVQSGPNWQWESALHVQTIKCWRGAGERCNRGPWPYMLPFTCPCAAFTMCTPSKAPFHTQTPHSFPPHTPPGLYLHWCDPKWYACQRNTKCFSHLPSTPFGVLLGVLHHGSVVLSIC